MTEDRERLRTLRAILNEAGYDWDLTGDPPVIPESELSADDLRRTIAEIQQGFPATLAAIAAGTETAPQPAESVGRFNHLSMTLLHLGVDFDGTEEPPDLAEVSFHSPEDQEWAEGILAEMLAGYPKTIAQRRAEGHVPILPSMFFAEIHRDAPVNPPLLRPRSRKT